MHPAVLGITLMFGGISVAYPAVQNDPLPITDPEAYKIYASLLPQIGRDIGAKTLVLQRETETYPRCMPSGGPLETEWRSVIDNYQRENSAVRFVLPEQPLQIQYAVIPSARIQASFNDGVARGWEEFYRQYPDSGGSVQVSAVGFNALKTRALVYIGYHCGGRCGAGSHHLLEKIDGTWREVALAGVTQCFWEA